VSGHLGPFVGQTGFETFLDNSKNLLEFEVLGGGGVWEFLNLGKSLLGLDTFMDEEGSITTIIN
jgi:hypothetical protein